MKRNEAKKLKRKEAKNYCFCFAKRSEKEAKLFLFRFVSLRFASLRKKNISENGTPYLHAINSQYLGCNNHVAKKTFRIASSALNALCWETPLATAGI